MHSHAVPYGTLVTGVSAGHMIYFGRTLLQWLGEERANRCHRYNNDGQFWHSAILVGGHKIGCFELLGDPTWSLSDPWAASSQRYVGGNVKPCLWVWLTNNASVSPVYFLLKCTVFKAKTSLVFDSVGMVRTPVVFFSFHFPPWSIKARHSKAYIIFRRRWAIVASILVS